MLLPSKHLKLAESIIGYGAYLLALIEKPQNLDLLWNKYENETEVGNYPAKHTYETFVLTIGYLFAIGALEVDSKGNISLCS